MTFAELPLSEPVQRALEVLGFEEATPIQAAAIPVLRDGGDVIGKSVTGSGKTFAFGIPMIEGLDDSDEVQGLVVCPTRELAEQVTAELRRITNSLDRVKIAQLTGGADMTRQIKNLKSAKLAVGTPGRILDHLKRRTLKPAFVRTVVLDEADEMLKMGFLDDIETILAAMPVERQTVMFSATMPEGAVRIASRYMRTPATVEIGEGVRTVETVRQGFVFCKNADKNTVLADILRAAETDKCLVFCNTRATVEQIAERLGAAHFNVRALHGQMRQYDRKRAMNAAKSYDGAVLVATDVAARGIDIADVELVVNYDVPHELDLYVHRIGRTARAGKTGTAVTIVTTRMQQAKLRGYADEANCTLVPMAVLGGKLVDTEAKKDDFEEKVRRAAEEGDLGKLRELEESRDEVAEENRTMDSIVENILGALRRKTDHTELISELETFGCTDRELLDAVLTLYIDARESLRRSHEDRAKKYGRRPFGDKKSYGGKSRVRKPYGERKYEAKDGESEDSEKPHRSYGGQKPYGDKPRYGEKKSYGDKKYAKSDRPSGVRGGRSYGAKKPYGKPRRPHSDEPRD